MFSSFGILIYGQKVSVLSNPKFYSYVKTESGTKGYVFSGFIGNSQPATKLISREYGSVYSGATRKNFIVAENRNDYYGYVKINDISTKGTVSQYNNMGCAYPIKETKYNNIYSVYGWRNNYRHLGFDINRGNYSSIKGVAAAAIFDGKVVFANTSYNSSDQTPDYGYCIIIESDSVDPVSGNKLRAVYMHLNEKPVLQVSNEVSAGDVVGKIGTTGNSTGPHLHLEINNKGANFAGTTKSDSFDKTINPMFFYLNTELSDGNDGNDEY